MPEFEVQVSIRRREGILDPQGQALEKSLQRLGFKGVNHVRVDKEIRLHLAAKNEADAEASAKKMCERLLANPVMEDALVDYVKPVK